MSEMQQDLNEQVVVAFFENGEAADSAAEALMKWDDANEEIKLGAMGRLTLKPDGELESKRYGHARTKKGALIGGAIGLVAGVFTGGLSLLGGALLGGALGGVTGSVTKGKGALGLSASSLEDVKGHLEAGRAAVVVLCDDHEVDATLNELRNAGGDAQAYGVSAEVLGALAESKIGLSYDERQARAYEKDITAGAME